MSENEMNQTEQILLDMYASDDRTTFGFAERLEKSIATEYHRTPSLPDVMEDGYVLAECVGIKWVVEIYDFLFVVALDTGVGRIAMSPEEAAKLGAPDLSKYHVQNNQIVKVEG